VLVIVLAVVAGAASAGALAVWRLSDRIAERQRNDLLQQQLALFAPAVAAVHHDPRQLLVWYPLAKTSRTLFPQIFAELDRATGGAFPFTRDQIDAAHARCTSEWLAWERAHDAEFSLKAAEVQHEIDRTGQTASHASPLLRTRLAAIEQQKLERYQQRYEEYVKTAKAIAGFVDK
jgi:hypothetical protein